jgi:competence protein ComEC
MPLLWLSLAFLGGILLAESIRIPTPGWCLLALLAMVPLIPPLSRRLSPRLGSRLAQLPHPLQLSPLTFYLLLIICLSAGAIRYQLSQPKYNQAFIASYNDLGTVSTIEGVIASPPDVRDTYVNLRLEVDQLAVMMNEGGQAEFTPVHGLLLARLPAASAYIYGDRLQLEGKLVTPPENEDFSYRDYLANHGIYSYIAYPSATLLEQGKGTPILAALYNFRQHSLDLIYSLYPDPEASLMAGILLGFQTGIPQAVQDAFRLTGTSHIIVISGFNITIIAAVFTWLFCRLLGVRKGFVLAVVGIIFYTLLVGANPAVVRAAILGIFALLGHQLGRQQTGINSLVIVAALMAFFTPMVLWDVSFQLSFTATLGIILYADPAIHWFTNLASRFTTPGRAAQIAGPVGGFFLLTLAAQLTTLPLMIYYFKRLSLTALIANPLILPAQPPLMVLGGLSVLLGMVFRPVGQLLAWAAWPFTSYTIRVVEWLAGIPKSSIALGQVALPLIFLFYAGLFAITFFHKQIIPTLKRMTPALPLAILGVAAILVWKGAFYAPDGMLHVTVLNVGTGDAILIQSPVGREVLINGGSSTVALSDALGRRLSPFNRNLDWLVIADIDEEDLAGIPANLERFSPTNVLWAGNLSGTRSASDLQQQLIALAIPTTGMLPGHSLDLGSGTTLKVLFTDGRGAVLLLEWQDFRMLLPMGLDFDTLDSLQHNMAMRNVSAVLLPESGYTPLNPPELINFLHPQLVLLSVAAGDKTGLPSPETIQALDGYNLLRTDQNGWIEITTDGSQMWVEVERK